MATSNYDRALDRCLRIQGTVQLDDKVSIEVSLRQYNGGETRVAIVKFGFKKDGERWDSPRIGRISPDQAAELGPLIVAAGGGEEPWSRAGVMA